ncbi:FBD-associated F-box protein [Trifolium repens]|nr:FBD-associated F-box protein [Trifolium repens]
MDDRISDLPDETLSHIISFLPSEDAFATREISKRWRPLWLLYPSPNLDFDDQRFFKKGGSYSSFKDMVNATIYTRRLRNQSIKSFRLRCQDNSITASDVVMWLIDAAERGIQYLDVHLPDTPNFHCCVFSFRNLVVLKLKGIHFSIFVSAHFPLLRTLHLNKVYFFEHDGIVEILNACPILEHLEVKNISIGYWSYEYDGECRSLPNLVRADISGLSAYDVHLEAFYNVKFLRMKEMFGYVPVFSNLTHLEVVYGRALESMRVYSSPSLNSQEKLEVVDELMAFPRSSSTCEVYFE